MYAVERLSRYITRGVYSVSGPFHPFGGAVDIIVVQQQDGSFKSSPWYVRFGKFQGVLKTKEKVVNICVNGTEAGFHMYLDHKGEAFFLSDPDTKEGDFFMSPPSSGDEKDGQMQNDQFKKTLSCDFDGSRTDAVAQIDGGNGKIVARTNSRRSRILGLVFGRRSMKEDNKDGNVQRISSLERAEFAADLLEVKWSTNLPTNDQRADNVTEKRSEGDCRNDGFNINDMVASHGETMDDSLGISIASREHFEEVDGHNSPCLRAHEEILEIYTLESADSVDRNEVISDSDLATLKTDKSDVKSEDFIHKNPSLDIQSSDLAEVPHDMEQTSTERDGGLTTGVSPVESGGKGVSSFIYCETLGSSSIRFDVSTDQVLEALKLSSGGGEEVEVHAEVLYETNEVISEVKPKPESCEENLGTFGHQNIDISRVGDSSVIQNPQADCASNGAFDNVTENSFVTDSPMAADEHVLSGPHSSFDVHLLGSQSIETEVGEVIHQDTLVEELAQEKETYTKPIDILENQSQIKEGESTGPNSYIPIFEFDEALCSTEEVESQSRCTFPHSCNPRDQIEVENTGEGKKVDEVVLSDVVNIIKESGATLPLVDAVNNSIPLSESLEDDRFLLKNTGSCVEKELHPELSLDASGVEIKDHPLVTPEGDAEHKLKDIYQEPSLEGFPQESMSRTSPMRIPRSRTHLGESELMLRSLPNVRSHIHDLETSNILHPLSCSLDLNSENYIRGVINKEGPVSSKLEADSESNLVEDQSTSETAATAVNIENRGEHGDIPIIPAVEISLCRHLLFEGMGVDAACQAFDAEKVDLERFTSLGPSLVKNDRLVVRIGGRYFPWDAAAPVILGMTSFGQKQIFEPESMIAVEQPGKDLNGDPSRAIVPSEGSWRIWPFSFKKSKTMSTVRSVPDGTNEPVVNTISESTRNLTGDNNIQKERIMKKKVRSITPTSEQIASLNLKEGQNVVTFTFSTPMLGRQQVDARIYLCKWNTRIVVSDVDGTITKSDVLGQFMPLVGKDWSHSGVTHLFSAIKENGYQLLFLSARAISQAYLTRQFLFNLKQDGKTLPDGPVLISPDGLFPSLYREVIRRAPHEFKISCLEDIKALFPPDCNPFYAGFGNRDTDEISYLRVGIPKGKIFIINPKGEVAVNHRVDTKSYTSLHALVNGMFPARSSAEQEDFNSWNYWKLPILDIEN